MGAPGLRSDSISANVTQLSSWWLFHTFVSFNPSTKLVASEKQLITFFQPINQQTKHERERGEKSVKERGKVRERERERECLREGESFREELAKACACLIKSLYIDN